MNASSEELEAGMEAEETRRTKQQREGCDDCKLPSKLQRQIERLPYEAQAEKCET